MTHDASPRFWKLYNELPEGIRTLADKQYELLKADPAHPSLHFKKVGKVWSVRVSDDYRALAAEAEGAYVWFWIGDHKEYERLIRYSNRG